MSTQELTPGAVPVHNVLVGGQVRLEPLHRAVHKEGMQTSVCGEANSDLWQYIPFGPIDEAESLFEILEFTQETMGWMSYAIVSNQSSVALGTVSLMNVRPEHRSAEIGCVVYSKQLQRTRAATETLFLVADLLFEQLKYRRFEWKCDNRNENSKNAAKRYGFQFEGVFRNDMIVKGENRDTAWYSITDIEWQQLRPAYLEAC